MIRSVVMRGKRWRILWERTGKVPSGECQAPHVSNKAIRLDPRLLKRDAALLETVLHELLHAASWDLDEEVVHEYAEVTAKTLLRLGYRRQGA